MIVEEKINEHKKECRKENDERYDARFIKKFSIFTGFCTFIGLIGTLGLWGWASAKSAADAVQTERIANQMFDIGELKSSVRYQQKQIDTLMQMKRSIEKIDSIYLTVARIDRRMR